VSDVDRVERFRLTLKFFNGVVIYFFNSDFKIFRRRVGIFSLFFLCCFHFLLKVHVVGLHSKLFVHFVIQATNLVQLYINML